MNTGKSNTDVSTDMFMNMLNNGDANKNLGGGLYRGKSIDGMGSFTNPTGFNFGGMGTIGNTGDEITPRNN